MYTYKHECPECGVNFSGKYLKPYKTPRIKKTCPECRDKREAPVLDLGGLKGANSCGQCSHFKESRMGWGKCGLNRALDNEEEYTLTWAIDNLSCQISFDEHEGYGDDLTGMVYYQDLCRLFEEAAGV